MEEIKKEKAVLAGITNDRKDQPYSTQATMDELAELAKTAGAEVCAVVLQPKDAPDTATYLGSGKLGELAEFCRTLEADLIIFDDELTGSQQRNIEEATDTRVIDRSTLILDIFASRAISLEGKLQVELAQMKYMLPRLGGMGKSLSRLGAGIGTRGPGESKLETDRRHIRTRISHLQRQLDEVSKRRNYARERRKKDGRQTAVLVGYTNAGKSTILNALTDAGVLAENKLFATLDPTARGLQLPDGREAVLIDTVGFIRKLPHHLVRAFRSTLEEAVYADVLLHVVDSTSPEVSQHLAVSEQLLAELGCGDTPTIRIFNKCDQLETVPPSNDERLYLSAETGYHMEELLKLISIKMPVTKRRMDLILPYAAAGLSDALRKDGKVLAEEYVPEGIKITADIEQKAVHRYEQYEYRV